MKWTALIVSPKLYVPRKRINQRVAILNGIDVTALGVPLRAVAGFYDNRLAVRAHQQRIRAHVNAVPFVRWRLLLPEDLWHDAEHGAAVEAKAAAVEVPNFHVAKVHARGLAKIPPRKTSVWGTR